MENATLEDVSESGAFNEETIKKKQKWGFL